MASSNLPVPYSSDNNPITLLERPYLTSRQYQADYLVNAALDSVPPKYQRHHHFLRRIRTIADYARYLVQNNVVELVWTRRGVTLAQSILDCAAAPRIEAELNEGNPHLVTLLKPHCILAGYQTLVLIDGVAQQEITRYLNDAFSKQRAYTANVAAARAVQPLQQPALAQARDDLTHIMELVHMLEALDAPHRVPMVTLVKKRYGVDLRPFLHASQEPLALPAPPTPEPGVGWCEPTQIAHRLGIESAHTVNLMLVELGWQTRDDAGNWVPAPAFKDFWMWHPFVSPSGFRGANMLWNIYALEQSFQGAKTPEAILVNRELAAAEAFRRHRRY